MQRLTNAHVSVVSHDGQRSKFNTPVRVDVEYLDEAENGSDFVSVRQDVDHEAGQQGRAAVDFVHKQAAHEQVHGLVQAFVHIDDSNEDRVGQDDRHVIQQCQGEVQIPELTQVVVHGQHKHLCCVRHFETK